MDLLRQSRPAMLTAALLILVVACSQLVNGPRTPSDPAGFSLTPSGGDVARLSPITVTFTQPPSEKSPEGVLQLLPATPGSYAWLSPRTLLFQPDFPGLVRGTTYTALVPARPEAGLAQTITKKFTVTGKLAVQQVIPGDGDTEVPLNAQVLVQFSRSVAPLTTLANQSTTPVVAFDPPLHGAGEWLNTSIYRFTPTDLVPTTTYQVKIARGLTSAADGVLESDYRSTFTTISPSVDAIVPDGAWLYGGPWQEAVVTFNQPMAEDAAGSVTVTRTDTGAAVTEKRTWNAERTVLTLSPTARMSNETQYLISVPKGLKSARGGVTLKERISTFTTVGPPSVKQTNPANGDTNAGRYGASLQFNTPMDATSFEGKIHVSGIADTDLEGRVNAYDFGVSVGVELEASKTYTVTLDPGALDKYGQPMGGFRFRFTTGAMPSTVSFALPGYGGTATYSSSSEPFLFFQTTNKTSVNFALHPLTAAEAMTTMHNYGLNPQFAPSRKAIRTWTETLAPAKDQVVLNRTSLSGGGPLPTGYYYLETDGQIQSRFVFAVVDTVLVTKLSLDELLVWALDHDTGKPLAGVPIRAAGAGDGEVVTDTQGLAVFHPYTPVATAPGGDRSFWLTTNDEHFGVVSTRWTGMSPYQFGLPGEYYARQYVGHVYSDRPIYRPGETVFYKGIVRADDDATYTMPPRDGFIFVMRNARSQEVARTAVTLDDFGSFGGFFDLPEDAPTGDYFVGIELAGTSTGQPVGKGFNGYTFASNSFTVAEFRKPEFQVEVAADRTSYVNGDTIAASATASFFFGGALAGATVDWSAIAEPFGLRVKGFESYSFADSDATRQSVAKNPIRAKGGTATAAGGVASFTVPAALNAAEGAQRFTLSANVTDQNGQAVAGGVQVTVHPAALYAGIRSERYVASVGSDAVLQLVTVDTDGQLLPDRDVTVRLYDRQWITTKVLVPGGGRRYQSDARDVLVATLRTHTSPEATASVAYRPTKAGTLRAVAEVTDAKGRTARSSTYLWVSGAGFALWQVTNDDTIKLIADKERYEVGDTAEVLVPAPFAGATALITVERGKIITREVRTLRTNSERLHIPIVDHSVPDVFVSVVLYRAPTDVDPLPRYKVGYVELPVSTQTRALSVKITPDRGQAKPGETAHYAIKVTDRSGKGVRSEVSVAVVDKAVLSLAEERGPDGLRAFWFERGLAVTTNSSMGVSLDRWNDIVAELPRVGKGGAGSGTLNGKTRSDFRNTAYWSAQLVTKEDGTATVDVAMPDDLTTWRMQARAISGDTMVGEGTNELVSTKPLLIRSALPRFLRVGDSVDLRVLVRNGTAAAARVPVTIKVEGPVAVAGPLTQEQQLSADGQSFAYVWRAKVQGEGPVKVTFSAATGDDTDAMAVSLPALIDLTPETMSTGGIVTKDAGVEAIYLPKFADTAHGTLDVSIRSALVGSLASELAWFGPFPGGHEEGTEWIASRLIATLAVARAEKAAGTALRFDARIATDIAGLIGRQRNDGGWSWCARPECVTDPNVTGWVLLALGEARRDGLSIDDGVAGRASAYVYGWVNRPNTTANATTNDQDQRAFLLAGLAASGRKGVWDVANALLEQYRTQLANWGKAYLINAFVDGGGKPTDEQPRILLNDLAATTIPSANGNHWEDPTTSSKASFMTSTATTALVALATARTQPEHQLLPQTVRWLVVSRSTGWQTSIDRAMSLLALSTYTVQAAEAGSASGYKVLLDDKEVLAGLVQPGTVPTAASTKLPLTRVTPGKTSLLAVQRDFAKSGRLYYSLDLRYMTPAQGIEAVNRGFAVSHTYTLLDDASKPVARAKLGEVVRVTLTVIAPFERNYVTVEDLLPAGLEAVDTRLRTTDAGLRAKLETDRTAAAQRGAGGYMAPWYRWYYSPWQQVDQRDDRTVLKAERVAKGVYEFVYYARATTTGDFFVAPAHAEEAYFPEVFGRSDSSRFIVEP